MKWDLCERTEDAVVAYLKSKVTSDIRVYAAWERDEPQYPCAVVHAGVESPVADSAEWHDSRTILTQVSVMSEAAPELDSEGKVIKTPRERNSAARSAVMDALYVPTLLESLTAQGIDGIAFSMAQATTAERSTEGIYLTSIITIEVIAEPVTGS
jgi:hypothetical protein